MGIQEPVQPEFIEAVSDYEIERNKPMPSLQSCWIVFPSFANIYVYSSPNDYEIYRAHETLTDKVLDISLPLKEVFE